MDWLKVFEVPSIMLAALVIILLYKLLDARDKAQLAMAQEMAENSKLLSKMAAILDLICTKVMGDKGGK